MYLVTGATGHIGNVLIKKLVSQNNQVRAFVLHGEDISYINDLSVEIFYGNILDKEDIIRALDGIDTVFHLAGMISILPQFDEMLYQVNVTGTKNMIEACIQKNIQKLVYTSSIHAIRRTPHGTMINEAQPFDSATSTGHYDRSKAEASLLVLEAVKNGLNAVIVCPTGVIGPFDFKQSEMGTVIHQSMKSKINFVVNGYYDFVDVRDVADGMIAASSKGKPGEVYILSGERISIPAISKIVQSISGLHALNVSIPTNLALFISRFTPFFYKLFHSKPRFTPYSIKTVLSNSNISNAKAARDLGFKPRTMIESITDTVMWMRFYYQRSKSVQYLK